MEAPTAVAAGMVNTHAQTTPVRSVEVLYPAGSLAAFSLAVHWLVAYLVLSIVFGFALKGVFKVEI